MTLKCLHALAAAAAFSIAGAAFAQSAAPALPRLTAEQAAEVRQQIVGERRTMEARVGRGEVTPDEAERFLAWREWQLAQKAAGLAPPPPAEPAPPRRHVYTYPAPYYDGPPPYWGPRYYGGPVICAGGWGHHVGGRVCF